MNNIGKTKDVVYGLWADGTLAYYNQAWIEFARQNGADSDFLEQWSLGRSVYDAIPEEILSFYQNLFNSVLNEIPGDEHTPVQHCYECSSPETFRKFQMTLYPLQAQFDQAILVVNSILVERSHEQKCIQPTDPISERYLSLHDLLTQCIYCRKFQRNNDEHQWDWIPEWILDQPRNTSHSLCHYCKEHYFSKTGFTI